MTSDAAMDLIFDGLMVYYTIPKADEAVYKRELAGKKVHKVAKGHNAPHVPNPKTGVVTHPEIKAPNQMKVSDVTDYWDEFLGDNQTNINPITGKADNNRIFSADGTRSIRFGNHEMRSMGTSKFHFHQEEWVYDSINDIMDYYNTLIRIK